MCSHRQPGGDGGLQPGDVPEHDRPDGRILSGVLQRTPGRSGHLIQSDQGWLALQLRMRV